MKYTGASFAMVVGLLIFPGMLWGWSGKVTSVVEGDLIEVQHDGKTERIRLFGIDCPEKKQDFGREAKEYTSAQVLDKEVEVEPVGKAGRKKTTTAIVYVEGRPLNQMLVLGGYAWFDPENCKGKEECRRWQILEAHARATKAGLWAAPEPRAPWEVSGSEQSSGGGKEGKDQAAVKAAPKD